MVWLLARRSVWEQKGTGVETLQLRSSEPYYSLRLNNWARAKVDMGGGVASHHIIESCPPLQLGVIVIDVHEIKQGVARSC
jgi:hypothetical protein